MTFTLYVVPSGGAAGATPALYNAVSVAANQTLQYDLEEYLLAGDTIQAFASSASVSMYLNGVQIQ